MISLVGAGPGDPELLTIRGLKRLQEADVVVHDALVGTGVLALARPDAELIDVGKRPGAPVPQELINELLVHLAQSGRNIVRLKGGDPFVFGRGGEEALALTRAGLDFEVVPGVSSVIAAPAGCRHPRDPRGVSASFTVVTGHRQRGEPAVNWQALAQSRWHDRGADGRRPARHHRRGADGRWHARGYSGRGDPPRDLEPATRGAMRVVGSWAMPQWNRRQRS
jgi:uroporphyrin-III C-methyltransferase